MNASDVELRRLGVGDGASFQRIRLEALQEAPEAFGASFDEEANQSIEYFESRVTSGCIFGAFLALELVGICGFYQQAGSKIRHKGVLWGMYVRSTSRRTGIGSALVEAVLHHSSSCVDFITLSVATQNRAAIALYSKFGFKPWGVEPHALRIGTEYVSETHMTRF